MAPGKYSLKYMKKDKPSSLYGKENINTLYKKEKNKISINILLTVGIFSVLFVLFVINLIFINRRQEIIKSGEFSGVSVPTDIKEGVFKRLDALETNEEKFKKLIEEIEKVSKTVGDESDDDSADVETTDVKKDEKKSDAVEVGKGTYAVYIKILGSGEEFKYNEDRDFFGASLFKAPLAVAALKNIEGETITLKTQFKITKEDILEGSGVLQKEEPGTEVSVERLLEELIRSSDNTAQSVFQRNLSIKSQKEAFDLSKEATKTSKFFSENVTDPKEVSVFLETTDTEDYLNVKSKIYLYKLMIKTKFDDRINIHLKKPLQYAHKIGNWPETGSWHDCGIVFGTNKKAVVCIMSEGTTYESFLDISELLAYFINGLF